jgi:uncharacterized membrane protein
MSHHESAAEGSGARLVDRMLFFSDAVFAIVLTLLVLELRPPHVEGEDSLGAGLLTMWKSFASFVISFVLGATFWVVHMRNTRTLRQFDWPVAVTNLLHLFSVALLPFAAAVFGEHIKSPITFAIYCGLITLTSFTATLLWLTITRDKGRLVGGIESRARMAAALRSAAPGVGFGCSLILMIAGADSIARIGWFAIIPVAAIANRLSRPAKA